MPRCIYLPCLLNKGFQMRRRYSAFPLFAMFGISSELFKLGLQTSQMLMSSGEVIFHRSQMIQQAIEGRRAWTDPEFTTLWQEKMFANMEALAAISKSIISKSLSPNNSLTKQSLNIIKAVTASTLPYHTKAGANARRLSKNSK